MPFSTGSPYKGAYMYSIDREDSKMAVVKEFSEKQLEYTVISKMRFMTEKIVDILFIGNFTITITDDNRIYMGIITDSPTKLYNSMVNDEAYKNRIIMVSGRHLIVSQCTDALFGNNKPKDDITFYYDRACKPCFKKAGKYYMLADPEWPNLKSSCEISEFGPVVFV